MNMIMKQLNFKIVLLFLTIYVCPHRTLAQKDTLLYRTLIQDSILIPQKSHFRGEYSDRGIAGYQGGLLGEYHRYVRLLALVVHANR